MATRALDERGCRAGKRRVEQVRLLAAAFVLPSLAACVDHEPTHTINAPLVDCTHYTDCAAGQRCVEWQCLGPMAVCGDGELHTANAVERCDDGNDEAGDGCSPKCTIEGGWTCAGEPSTCAMTSSGPTLCPSPAKR